MKLEELVPPLEVCKLIPQGEFEDCALVFEEVTIKGEVCKEIISRHQYPRENTDWLKFIPAPTLQEIMAELPASNIYRIKQTWTANFINDSIDNGIKSKKPATAALKLWLKLKGIEYGK